MTIRVRYQWLLLASVVLGVYYPAIFGGYSAVDDVSRLNRLLNIETFDFYHLFFRSGGYYYRPITAATFYFDQIFWYVYYVLCCIKNNSVYICDIYNCNYNLREMCVFIIFVYF